jgi:hypothetical protein
MKITFAPLFTNRLALIVSMGGWLLFAIPAAGAPLLEDIDRRLENIGLEKLAYVQQQPGNTRMPFTTDGCSGGMSEGWEYLADAFPAFKEKFGNKPPWENCCVTHDRVYWEGETEHGYEKRQQADLELKACVIDTGNGLSGELASRFDADKDQVEQAFTIAAELIYRAVRIGGKPCTRLPWRWGYGWPHCPIIIHDLDAE